MTLKATAVLSATIAVGFACAFAPANAQQSNNYFNGGPPYYLCPANQGLDSRTRACAELMQQRRPIFVGPREEYFHEEYTREEHVSGRCHNEWGQSVPDRLCPKLRRPMPYERQRRYEDRGEDRYEPRDNDDTRVVEGVLGTGLLYCSLSGRC